MSSLQSNNVEDMIAKGNLVHFQGGGEGLFEVRVFDKNGKLKKTVSREKLKIRHWEIAKEESKNKRFSVKTTQRDNHRLLKWKKEEEHESTGEI